MVSKQKPLSFFDCIEDVTELIAHKEVFIFLDYDGTLTPIVDTPDMAVLSEDMKTVVQELSDKYKVSIVSGRATHDVRSKVNIDHIFYAGSHGFEILRSDGDLVTHPDVSDVRPVIEKAFDVLVEKGKTIPGVLIEDVKFTISVHYRLVEPAQVHQVESFVYEVLEQFPELRKTDGKKVFELRPRIEWHKGKAVEWIMNALGFDRDKNSVVYIGDDRTDEDAFEVVEPIGFGVFVGKQNQETRARYYVNNVAQVRKVLDIFNHAL